VVAGTGFSIRLAEEDYVFDESAIPTVNCTNFHSSSIFEAEIQMKSNAASFSFQAQHEITDVSFLPEPTAASSSLQAESQHEITDVRKRKTTDK
jgi:hypothetical protein